MSQLSAAHAPASLQPCPTGPTSLHTKLATMSYQHARGSTEQGLELAEDAPITARSIASYAASMWRRRCPRRHFPSNRVTSTTASNANTCWSRHCHQGVLRRRAARDVLAAGSPLACVGTPVVPAMAVPVWKYRGALD